MMRCNSLRGRAYPCPGARGGGEYDATVYPQEVSDAASVWFLRRRNAAARLRYAPRPKQIRVAWMLRRH